MNRTNLLEAAILSAILFLAPGCGLMKKPLPPGQAVSKPLRLAAIERASVWTPTNIPAVDFKTGPRIDGAFAPDQWVTCTYKKKKMGGQSPKFTCETSPGHEVKVKYGSRNAEIFGEVLASRLFWGLGFAADRMFPVRIRCQGCSDDPKRKPEKARGTQVFELAAIERKLPGRAMETTEDSGWKWSELDNIGPEAAKDARAQRDALKLLAAFIQHSDSKAPNQRLLCPEGQDVGKTSCRAPVLMVQDLGLTFGEATLFNKNKNAASFVDWAEVPVWADPARCVARLKGSFTGTIKNPEISEAGRAFLASLLAQLTDAQLRDLFEVSRIKRRSADPSSVPEPPPASISDWVNVFKLKRAQIVDHRCPR